MCNNRHRFDTVFVLFVTVEPHFVPHAEKCVTSFFSFFRSYHTLSSILKVDFFVVYITDVDEMLTFGICQLNLTFIMSW